MMRWLPQDNGTSTLTTHQPQVERICVKINPECLFTLKNRYAQSLMELVDFLEKDPEDKKILTKYVFWEIQSHYSYSCLAHV